MKEATIIDDVEKKGILNSANKVTDISKGWQLIYKQLIFIAIITVVWSIIPLKNVLTFVALIIGLFIILKVYGAIKNKTKIVLKEFGKDLLINTSIAVGFYYLAMISVLWGIVGFILLAFVYAGYRIIKMKDFFVSSAKNFGKALKDMVDEGKEEKK
jgi:hypothetical protein